MNALVAAVACATAIGVTLGLLGAGGSILTVPLLAFVAELPPRVAISSSLFAVAVTAAVTTLGHARAGRVRWRIGLVFGSAGIVGALAGGRLSSQIPERALMVLFGVTMGAAAIAMLRRRGGPAATPAEATPDVVAVTPPGAAYLALAAQGVAIGCLTGLIGAGGGFIIVPALVLLARLPMHTAVGTSLMIITMNASAGLAGRLVRSAEPVTIAWTVTLAVTAAMLAGSLVGVRLAGRVRAEPLRRGFGWFVVAMSVFVLASQA
jgi:uncharacterized membrane protein YfcA